MRCPFCKGRKVKNLGCRSAEHLYCPDCKAHKWAGKWITRQEWEQWIESSNNLDVTSASTPTRIM